jgi:hypothetical protein
VLATAADGLLATANFGEFSFHAARETDASGPEHHAEENDQVPVMLDQGIELAVDA